MKQMDFESSNYKRKDEVKLFTDSFNELVNKYSKAFQDADADLNKVNNNIEKKNASISKLETSILDLNMRLDELTKLRELSNEEIKTLNSKKSEISYSDSEVQKMELEDLNAQVTAKKAKISKIDAKMDTTKNKIKADSESKKVQEKELKDLEKIKKIEEETCYRTESLNNYLNKIKEDVNKNIIEIISAPYKRIEETNLDEKVVLEEISAEQEELDKKIQAMIDDHTMEYINPAVKEEPKAKEPIIDLQPKITEPIMESPIEFGGTIEKNDKETPIELEALFDSIRKESLEDISPYPYIEENDREPIEENSIGGNIPIVDVLEQSKEADSNKYDSLLEDVLERENLSLDNFNSITKEKLVENKDLVINNIDILKRHEIPLEYVLDQSEILYNISSQDLDDLLSIITTDDEGNGMGFTIDFTYNILSELSKIDVDQLIDVYNREFMNVNAKSGIISLLKETNPNIGDFDKNRRVNIELLKSLGTNSVDEIIEKYPEFINIDNPLFINILNVFDRDDLIEKLNKDIGVIPKMMDYWKNN